MPFAPPKSKPPSPKVVRLAEVREHRAADDPAALLGALRRREPWAERALVERHTQHVERILTRVLGSSAELDDLAQEVFVRAFARVDELREPGALRGWLTAIAVFVAREVIRARRRRRWLLFLAPAETPDPPTPAGSPEARAALRAFYEVVSHLGTDERIAFTLRFVEGMELTEIAAACGISLATVKRRLARAEAEFTERARAHEELAGWIEEGTRWRRLPS